MAGTVPLLETRQLSKAFAGKNVVSDVDFSIEPGEIVALIGENGAGKSTLKNMLVGTLQPTEGSIIFEGQELSRFRVGEYKIAAVHQELSLFLNLSVAENICITDLPGTAKTVNWRKCREEVSEYLSMVSADFSPDTQVESLGPGERQLVEIAKAIRQKPRLLILDEPTTSLTSPERSRLFVVMQSLKRQGMAMIFITHFIDEVFEVSDRVVVLRNGKQVGASAISEITKRKIEELMVGRAIEDYLIDIGTPASEVALQVKDFHSEYFADVNLAVKKGEILGIAGLMGAGRTEFIESIFGLRRTGGKLVILGKELSRWTPHALIERGVLFIPEDRKNSGIFPTRDLKENISSAKLSQFVHRTIPGLGFRGEKAAAEAVLQALKIAASSIRALITSLSGGNQQKSIVGRWLSIKPRICIFDDPTRGVDIGAKEEIHSLIAKLACDGAAVVLVSSDINEILLLAHRALIMRKGKFVAEFKREDFDARRMISVASSTGASNGSQVQAAGE
jgi:ABC-type sugar transport system ATPase subunit